MNKDEAEQERARRKARVSTGMDHLLAQLVDKASRAVDKGDIVHAGRIVDTILRCVEVQERLDDLEVVDGDDGGDA